MLEGKEHPIPEVDGVKADPIFNETQFLSDAWKKGTRAWVEAKAKLTTGKALRLALGYPQVSDLQKRLFNILQVLKVFVDEMNEPILSDEDSDDVEGYRHRNGTPICGLEIMRVILCEIYYSTPRNIRESLFPPAQGDRNNLSIVLTSVRLGGMRQIGRLLQSFQRTGSDWKALQDFAHAIIHCSLSSNVRDLTINILASPRDTEHQLIWRFTELIFQQAQMQGGDRDMIHTMMKIAFYNMAAINRIDPWVAPNDIINEPKVSMIDPLLGSAALVIDGEHGHMKDILITALEGNDLLVRDMFKLILNPWSHMLQGLYQEDDKTRLHALRYLISEACDLSVKPHARIEDVMNIVKNVCTNPKTLSDSVLIINHFLSIVPHDVDSIVMNHLHANDGQNRSLMKLLEGLVDSPEDNRDLSKLRTFAAKCLKAPGEDPLSISVNSSVDDVMDAVVEDPDRFVNIIVHIFVSLRNAESRIVLLKLVKELINHS